MWKVTTRGTRLLWPLKNSHEHSRESYLIMRTVQRVEMQPLTVGPTEDARNMVLRRQWHRKAIRRKDDEKAFICLLDTFEFVDQQHNLASA